LIQLVMSPLRLERLLLVRLQMCCSNLELHYGGGLVKFIHLGYQRC
jgi:hypothetical protein